eukprot:NODE_5474_length_673_cov_18.467949_g5099_i0.p1 GENE.NODE_5474_length_673_cov_18.467949_g5099_i0~~NODE_5474_length_673_cov_18.467949_g5099_i0.p1  ORF type:complete len:153 (-),score=46.06 NODE_5474_length_673_cov_18.467949_g5099_i0:214-624(-)
MPDGLRVEGRMDGAGDDDDSSSEEEGPVETEFSQETAEEPTKPVPTAAAPAVTEAPAKLDDSSEEEETKPNLRANALAGIDLKRKGGRSNQGLLFKLETKSKPDGVMTNPGYGDDGSAVDEVALTTFTKKAACKKK